MIHLPIKKVAGLLWVIFVISFALTIVGFVLASRGDLPRYATVSFAVLGAGSMFLAFVAFRAMSALKKGLILSLQQLKEQFEGLSAKELDALIKKHNIRCPKCKGALKEVGMLNLMFGFPVGAYSGAKGYLRPETAQGAYVSFKREYAVNREKLPLGLAIIGRAYRNEISPRQGLFRTREFTQAELQIFFDPGEAKHPRFNEIDDYKLRVVLASKRDKGVQEIAEKGYESYRIACRKRAELFDERIFETKMWDQIGKVLKILDKINHAKEMTLGSLSLEDAEFDIVYESVDSITWLPAVMKFGEFFEEIRKVKGA